MIQMSNQLVVQLFVVARQAERSIDSALPPNSKVMEELFDYYNGDRMEFLDHIGEELSRLTKEKFPEDLTEDDIFSKNVGVDLLSKIVSALNGCCLFKTREIFFMQKCIIDVSEVIRKRIQDEDRIIADRINLFHIQALIIKRFLRKKCLAKMLDVESFRQPDFIKHFSIKEVMTKKRIGNASDSGQEI